MVHVLVIPTDGFRRGKPSPKGRKRLDMLEKIIENEVLAGDIFSFGEIAIIGGWPDFQGESLAWQYMRTLKPQFREWVTIMDDSSNNTVDDVVALIQKLRKKYYPLSQKCREHSFQIHFVSSWRHFRRVKWTIEKFEGFDAEHIDSGEDCSFFSAPVDYMLMFVNWFDPLWDLPEGWMLRGIANMRARIHYFASWFENI